MKKVVHVFICVILALIVNPTISSAARGQDAQPAPRLFIGGGALPEALYQEFRELTGPDAKLVVIPTASSQEVDVDDIQKRWQSRGFQEVSVLHTNDRDVASSPGFADPLRTATAVWISGGSQQRIADAYIGTPVERELYQLLERGGVIGGSSAGAAIQTRIMIRGGDSQPRISTGLDLLPGAIIDQHFLKRNRLSRLIEAVRSHPGLIGFGIDEGTAIVVYSNEYRVVGKSYVLRVEFVEGEIKIDAFEDGDVIPITDR